MGEMLLKETPITSTQIGKPKILKVKLNAMPKDTGKSKTYVCDIIGCNQTFMELKEFMKHKETHEKLSDVVYECHAAKKGCSSRFSRRSSLKSHWAACPHNPEREGPFYCHIQNCAKKEHAYEREQYLKKHLRQDHGLTLMKN